MELTQEKLQEKLNLHQKWLNSETDGIMLDLYSANLHYADLHSADLRFANLCSADLRFANLCSADLRSADLRSANLCSADLCSANLRSADLCYANLRSADLCSANLHSANLHYADLHSADLRSADLRSADLCSANLCSADLRSADLRSADYQVRQILSSNWGEVSDELCLELMRWDCLIVGEAKFQAWVDKNICPFIKSNIHREFLFIEQKELWKPGNPTMNFVELFKALCLEKEIEI